MKTARYAEIPEFDFEVKEAVYTIGGPESKRPGEPTGAMRLTVAGEGGDFQLYVRKELLQGLEPKVGDVYFARVSIDGTFEPRITVRSLRPGPVTASKASA